MLSSLNREVLDSCVSCGLVFWKVTERLANWDNHPTKWETGENVHYLLSRISFLSFSGKMYVKCRGRIERKVENTPCVFRPGRSTADEIFTLQQIFGKSWEYAKDVYTCFGNLEKAYDQVPREKRVLWEYGVRGRLFLAVKSLYFCLCRRIMSQLFTVCV